MAQTFDNFDLYPTQTKLSFRLHLRLGNGTWRSWGFAYLPVERPCAVVIEVNHPEATKAAEELAAATAGVLTVKLGAAEVEPPDLQDPQQASKDENLLIVVVCDGTHAANATEAMRAVLTRADGGWLMPAMAKSADVKLLDETLSTRNIAFWKEAPGELALTVLARAGVTSLDRRVFVSYRRNDTSPMADQLFDGLTRRNFDVFLDRVSIEVGVNFQDKLFEHLADKSMVVLLHSTHFMDSPWTRAEVDYAHRRRLSLLVLRLPGVGDDLGQRLRAGEMMQLREDDIEWVEVEGFSAKQARLKREALAKVLDHIEVQHDLELVGRLRDVQKRILDAVDAAGLTPVAEESDASVRVAASSREYVLCGVPHPPALPEMFRASGRVGEAGAKGIVVGHVAAFSALRNQQMDWMIKDRNVVYADVDGLSVLMDMVKRGAL